MRNGGWRPRQLPSWRPNLHGFQLAPYTTKPHSWVGQGDTLHEYGQLIASPPAPSGRFCEDLTVNHPPNKPPDAPHETFDCPGYTRGRGYGIGHIRPRPARPQLHDRQDKGVHSVDECCAGGVLPARWRCGGIARARSPSLSRQKKCHCTCTFRRRTGLRPVVRSYRASMRRLNPRALRYHKVRKHCLYRR